MAARQDFPTSHYSESTPGHGGWQRAVKQLLGVFGAIALFLGFFILFAGDNQSLGFWDSTWQVGEISEWWGYGFIIGGGVLWVGLIAWLVQGRSDRRL